MARDMDVHVQSHICEQRPEVAYTLNLFPDHEHCAAIFERTGLLTDKVYIVWLVAMHLAKFAHNYNQPRYM